MFTFKNLKLQQKPIENLIYSEPSFMIMNISYVDYKALYIYLNLEPKDWK